MVLVLKCFSKSPRCSTNPVPSKGREKGVLLCLGQSAKCCARKVNLDAQLQSIQRGEFMEREGLNTLFGIQWCHPCCLSIYPANSHPPVMHRLWIQDLEPGLQKITQPRANQPEEAQNLSIQEINCNKLYLPPRSYSLGGWGRPAPNKQQETLSNPQIPITLGLFCHQLAAARSSAGRKPLRLFKNHGFIARPADRIGEAGSPLRQRQAPAAAPPR